MIIIARIRYALVLLLMICPQPSLPNPTDPFDWKLCNIFACFVPGECGGGLRQKEQGVLGEILNKPSDACDIILMKKAYSAKKWLMVGLYNANTSASSGFELKNGTEVIFGCKAQEHSVAAVPGKYNSELVAGHLSSNYLYCEVTISDESKLFDSMPDTLELAATDDESKTWSLERDVLVDAAKSLRACDPSSIVVDYKGKPSHLHYDMVDSKPLVLTCKDPSTQSFVYVNGSDVHENATVGCNLATQRYNVSIQGEDAKEIQGNFTAYCRSIACVRCSDVRKPSNCRNCTSPTFKSPSPSSTCAQLQCKGNRFDINGKLVVGQPKCISTDNNEITWQIKNINFTEATCGQESVDCHMITPLNVSKCATCEKVDAKKDVITCSPSHELRVQGDDQTWFRVSKITCDKSTSEWRAFHGSMGSKLLSTNIQCIKLVSLEATLPLSATPPSEASPGFMKDPRLYIGAGIAFAICLIMALVAFLVYYCVIRKKTAKDDAEPLLRKRKMGEETRARTETGAPPTTTSHISAPLPLPAVPLHPARAPDPAAPPTTAPAPTTSAPTTAAPAADTPSKLQTCTDHSQLSTKREQGGLHFPPCNDQLGFRGLSISESTASRASARTGSHRRRPKMTKIKRDSQGRTIVNATPVGQQAEIYDEEGTQLSTSEAVNQPYDAADAKTYLADALYMPECQKTQRSISEKEAKKENKEKEKKKEDDTKNAKNPQAKDSKADKKN